MSIALSVMLVVGFMTSTVTVTWPSKFMLLACGVIETS
jgi:hypothetical protein